MRIVPAEPTCAEAGAAQKARDNKPKIVTNLLMVRSLSIGGSCLELLLLDQNSKIECTRSDAVNSDTLYYRTIQHANGTYFCGCNFKID